MWLYGHRYYLHLAKASVASCVVLMIDPHITNYTAQQCPSPRSSTLTFINILLVSLGARHFIPVPPKKSAVVVIQELDFHCNKTLFVLGSDTSEKK